MIVSTANETSKKHIELIKEITAETVVVYQDINDIPPDIAAQTEILLTFGNDLTQQNLGLFPRVKWIQIFSSGLEDLPFNELSRRDILVTNASGIHILPMREYVLMCMLHFEKDMERYRYMKQDKVFDRTKMVGELIGREVLIYGTGVIGKAVAAMLSFFEVKVYGVNTSGKPVQQFLETYAVGEEINRLRSADYVISILPSTSQTRGMFERDLLEQIKPEAVFISMGRGDVVDEDYVAQMVQSGRLKGAAFDVFREEPLPVTSPLWACENFIVTPHMSAKSIYYLDRCIDIFIKNLFSYRSGDNMINQVDISRGY